MITCLKDLLILAEPLSVVRRAPRRDRLVFVLGLESRGANPRVFNYRNT